MTDWIDEIVSPHVKDRIAWSGALEFAGAAEDDRTGRTVQFRLIRDGSDLLVAHPFAKYTRRRRGHAGTRFNAVFSPVGGGETVSGEVMLLNWADGPQGATVKFLLEAEAEDHPFLNCKRKSADSSPDTFMGVLMELDDDDQIVNQVKRERVEKPPQRLSNVAAMMVKHEHFHAYLAEFVGPEADDHMKWDTARADEWLKDSVGIASKADLDKPSNPIARSKFMKLQSHYSEWLHRSGYDRD